MSTEARRHIYKQYKRIQDLAAGEIHEKINSIRGGLGVLSIDDVHPHWLWNPPRRRRLAEQQISDDEFDAADPSDTERTTRSGGPDAMFSISRLRPRGTPVNTTAGGDDSDDELLEVEDFLKVVEPSTVKTKGRPKGATKASMASRRRRNITRRDPSAFEIAEDNSQRRVSPSQLIGDGDGDDELTNEEEDEFTAEVGGDHPGTAGQANQRRDTKNQQKEQLTTAQRKAMPAAAQAMMGIIQF
ncbi:MAG: hypothetical protein Q9182_004104 [Xanthomendoza sp. 2 TL-2023]